MVRTRSSAPPDAPPYAFAVAALVFLLAALSVGWPVLTGQFSVNPMSDEYIAGYAFREYGAAVLRETGGFPLWNPYLFGGLPFVAAMHGDIFYPTFLLRAVMDTDLAMTLAFVIHTFLSGLFTYGFLRAVGLGFYPALLGGLAYMLGGNVAGLVSPGHDGKLYVAAMLPASLGLLVRGVRDGRAWAWGLLAIVVGLAVLSPHPQLLQYMLLAGGFFALYVAFADWEGTGRLPRDVALKRLGLALAAVAVGMLMGAIQYVPVFEYVEFSPRAGGLPAYEVAASYSMPPEELINFYLPQFTGILNQYWGRNAIHLHSEYLGAAVMLLAGLAFWSRRRSFLWFWFGVFVITLLWALGGFTPFYRIVYAIVPGTKFFRAPSTILYIVGFSVAVLAALGTERLLAARAVSRTYLIAWGAVGVVLAVLATAGGLTSLATNLADPRMFQLVQENQGELVVGAWRSLLFLGAAIALAALYAGGRLSPRAAGVALALVVAVDLWSIVRRYWMFMPPAEVIYAPDPAIEYLQRLPEPARVLAVPLSEQMAFHDPFLGYDALMSHRIRLVMGYHGNELARYQRLGGYRDVGLQYILGPTNFQRLANLQYVYTNVPELPIEGAQRVVGPVQNAAGSTVYLYRLPGEAPFAWVTPAIVEAPDEAVYPAILDPRFDVSRVAVFDTAAAVTARQLTEAPPPLDIAVRTVEYAPGRIELELSAPAPAGAALVVSENFYPGWRATVDGRPATVGRANYSFVGVELPEGARQVELTFVSEPYQTGKVITLAALALAVVATAAGLVVERRRRA